MPEEKHRPVGPGLLLAPLEERWGPRAKAVGRRLAVRSDDDLPLVRASAVAAGQVLDVLVDNAVRHGGGTVDVSARGAFGGLVIEVREQGAGIADEDLEVRPGGSPPSCRGAHPATNKLQ